MPEFTKIFAYGSLIFTPELPNDVVTMHPARLRGYRRQFNKRSTTRSCPKIDSFDAFPPDPHFFHDGVFRSLVLGTQEDSTTHIAGMLIDYPKRVEAQLLRLLDRREGYDEKGPSAQNGYLRRGVTVDVGAGARSAVTYLSTSDPACVHLAPAGLTRLDRAKILINATPRRPRGAKSNGPNTAGSSYDFTRDSRGLYYLEGVRLGLRQVGIVDPVLESLAAAIRSLEGEWTSLVYPPADRGTVG